LQTNGFRWLAPLFGNSLAMGIIGTAYIAVGGTKVIGRYVIDPDDSSDLEIVEGLLFTESELEALPG